MPRSIGVGIIKNEILPALPQRERPFRATIWIQTSISDEKANDTSAPFRDEYLSSLAGDDLSRPLADHTPERPPRDVDHTSASSRHDPELEHSSCRHADDISEHSPKHADDAYASFRCKLELEHSSRQHADNVSEAFRCEHAWRRPWLYVESGDRADSLTIPL